MSKTKTFVSNLNKIMESELSLIKSLDIKQDPYVQTQSLIDQALLLLYGVYYVEYLQKQQEQDYKNKAIYYIDKKDGPQKQKDYNLYFKTLWSSEINCYNCLYPATLGEFVDLITQLYILVQQIKESMDKCMSELPGGFNYITQISGVNENDQQTNMVWSENKIKFTITLQMLADTDDVYFDDIGINLLGLKRLGHQEHALSLKLCGGPVLGRTQGIIRGLMYIEYKQIQAYELELRLRKINKKKSKYELETKLKQPHCGYDVLYVIKGIEVLENVDYTNIDILIQPLGLKDSNSEYIANTITDDHIRQWFKNSIYGQCQFYGSGDALTAAIWLNNPLLSQTFVEAAEYFVPHHLDKDDPKLIMQLIEWLLFANIEDNEQNKEWLEWRIKVRQFVEMMVGYFDGPQISVIIGGLIATSNMGSPKAYTDMDEQAVEKMQDVLTKITHSHAEFNPLLQKEQLYELGHSLIGHFGVHYHYKNLSKSFVELRAKLLAAPYQYGKAGQRLEI